jgi:anti-anti-sigma factor
MNCNEYADETVVPVVRYLRTNLVPATWEEDAVGIALTSSDGANLIRLEGEINIDDAAALKESLVKVLEGGDLRVSLEDAGSLDVTAMELLWAAVRDARAKGMRVELAGTVPEAVSAAFSEAGFEAIPGHGSTGEGV